MRRAFSLAAVVTVLGTLAFAAPAQAQTPPAPPPANAAAPMPAPAAPEQPTAPVDPEAKPYKPFAVMFNPLSAALGRYSFDLIYLPARHHALVLNPYGQFIEVGESNNKTSYSNFGAEVGYRFYTGARGANGFFVGPFVTYTSYKTETTAGSATASASFSAYGAGIDIGGQHVWDFGLSVGGGFGLMYLKGDAAAGTQTSSTVKVEGVLPRFLLSVGWSFG